METKEWLPCIGDLVRHRGTGGLLVVNQYNEAEDKYQLVRNETRQWVTLHFIRTVTRPFWLTKASQLAQSATFWQVDNVVLLKKLEVVVHLTSLDYQKAQRTEEVLLRAAEHRAWKRTLSGAEIRASLTALGTELKAYLWKRNR